MNAPAPAQRPSVAEQEPRTATSRTDAVVDGPDQLPAGPEVDAGWLEEEGAFVLPLGGGVRLGPDVLGDEQAVEIPLTHLPDIPGLNVTQARFNRRRRDRMVALSGNTAIPLTQPAEFTLRFNRDGEPARFDIRTRMTIDWLDNPRMRLNWSPEQGLSTELTVEAAKFVPQGIGNRATAEGDLQLGLADGKLSGAIDTTVTIPNLVEGHFEGDFGADGLSATVRLANQAEWLGELVAEGNVNAEGQLSARLEKNAGEMSPPVPGLDFLGGTLAVALEPDGSLSGAISDLGLRFGGMAETEANFNLANGAWAGSANLAVNIPGLSEASGSLSMSNGRLSGSFTLGKDDFPEGLPLQNGTITGSIGETGAMLFDGEVGIQLGPAGAGQLQARYAEQDGFSIGAEFDLSVPGLQTASFAIAWDGGDISGEGELAVDPELLSGIEGRVRITYAESRWAGETTLAYSADDGKLAGEITVRVRQAGDDSLKVSGDGEVAAQIAPRLQGTLRAEILEEGGIDVSGEIVVTEPLEMFPEQRFEREFLDVSRNIPLWAIVVAVLRIRAGVRAGIGPGEFRDIRVTGSYTIGEEGEPSFAISGEMFIPAFVEGYVGFGAGLGASVVLGSLTGGIEAMGTAGLYGAVSVVPELAYEDGDYSIEGVATMAAGARLKLSLNAWAEVEAMWVTVWENTWELASVTMPVGPDLGLEARMAYTFGNPEPPTLEFNSSDVDTDSLIQDAMPEDGPPSAGVREQVRNEARWQGAQRAAGSDADQVPPELQQQANEQETVPEPQAGSAPEGPGAPPPGQTGDGSPREPVDGESDPAAAQAASLEAAERDPAVSGTVPDDQLATPGPRAHEPVSLAMLDEPPVPMPRSREQQQADVRAAAELVRKLTDRGETTDQLDEWFPRIKRRFALGQIGYMMDGSGISVLVKVNAEEKVSVREEIRERRTRLINNDPTRKTKVKYETVDHRYNIPGESRIQSGMGARMVADPLTPLHGQGSGPRDSALAEVFALLETQGETGSQGYIKGHLLNDNLGGPGEDRNLFPITQTANTRHSTQIEETAKELVNDRHYWVRYEVEMHETGQDQYRDRNNQPRLAIHSVIEAKLGVLRTDLSTTREVARVSIPSRFNFEDRGAADFAGVSRRQLQDTVDRGDADAAAAQQELEERDRIKSDFDLTPETQVERTLDEDLLRDLQSNTDSQFRQDQDITQDDILESSARSGADRTIRLTSKVVAALTVLSGRRGDAVPFAGAADLTRRLTNATVGTSSYAALLAAAAPALRAHRAEANGDIALDKNLTTTQKDVLRRVNSDAKGQAILDVVEQYRLESDAAERLNSKRDRLALTDLEFFRVQLQYARPSERFAFTALVAEALGSRNDGRAALRRMGKWESSDKFYISLRNKVEKRSAASSGG